MSVGEQQLVSEVAGASALLADLCLPFAPAGFTPECVVIHPDAIPNPQDDLLVHHDHMTIMLQKHHGSAVDVHVFQEHHERESYTRKIGLTPKLNPEKVVEWGIARLNFRHIPDAVRDEILAKKLPLGAILIKHELHRRVKPRYFLRLRENGAVMKLFGPARGSGDVFGRLGMIYCDGEPAIELLEIVLNCDRK